MLKFESGHEEYCYRNAALFTAVRGRSPFNRTRREFTSLADAEAYAGTFGDGCTMIYAVTALGHSAHLFNR